MSLGQPRWSSVINNPWIWHSREMEEKLQKSHVILKTFSYFQVETKFLRIYCVQTFAQIIVKKSIANKRKILININYPISTRFYRERIFSY